ncbi:MAG: NAD(P)-dependent oxidoreductase [Gemmatimonadetes bacterium]|jgi:UDP-glucose 4-epimerase|nr:NAD(P)-dependent oxidoreductase [Gemmatimonadota bacterium]
MSASPRGSSSALILGGAGFLGSHTVGGLAASGWRVTVIDGELPGCGGDKELLTKVRGNAELIECNVEEVDDLGERLADCDVVIDAMGWTRHREGLANPLRDMDLNLACHLHVISKLPRKNPPRVIYLGSRGQYGQPDSAMIDEDTPMVPRDPQGVHKVAAESHFRVYAGLWGLDVTSLRLPNCYGPGQPVAEKDIGLVGGFIRDLLAGRVVEIYGGERVRYLGSAADVATVVGGLVQLKSEGFRAYNYAGHKVTLGELVKMLRDIIGQGDWVDEPMPSEIGATDTGDAVFSDSRLRQVLPDFTQTNLADALSETVEYFRESVR